MSDANDSGENQAALATKTPEGGRSKVDCALDPERHGRVAASNKLAIPSRWQKLDYAHALARAGLRIFPCREDEPDETDPEKIAAFKRPLAGFDRWQRRATTNRDRIKALWQEGNYNLGVATGPGGRIIVLDLDVKNGLPGLETLRRLETEYALPPVRRQHS